VEDLAPSINPNPEAVCEVAKVLGGLTIVHKGSLDVISDGKFTESCSEDGSPRR